VLRVCALILLPCALASTAAAQVLPGGDAAAQMVRAAGMPLQVSDLPAGTLTVRLVRGAFVENLEGRAVRVEIAGGRTEEGRTDADGRATFTLSPGAVVRALVTVDGERLESEQFALPPAGGVRVLLVAGGADAAGAAHSAGAVQALPPDHPPIAGSAAPPIVPAQGRETDIRFAASGILGGLTLAAALMFLRRARRRP
jgi:hypothetical protein